MVGEKGAKELMVLAGEETAVLAAEEAEEELVVVVVLWVEEEAAVEEEEGRGGSALISLERMIRPVSMLQRTSQREGRSSNRGLVTPAM